MRLIEARDGFVKVELEEKISLSSFIELADTEKKYIAQIVQIKRGGNTAIAYAKLLFLYDGILKDYDNTLPSRNVQITEFSFDIMSKSFECKKPIMLGKYIDQGIDITLDDSYFNNSMLVCVDNLQVKNVLLSNIQKQVSTIKNSIILDTTGKQEGDKYIAGVDFKLPLNTDSLAFIYEDCLNDATGDSKSMIKSIFQELSEYSKSVGFLPFDALKTIIDEMVEKAHVFKLIVLKNKLEKYKRLGYFASTQEEAECLENILSENSTIDLSKLEPTFLNRYIASIYKILNEQKQPGKVIAIISNNVSKTNLKEILINKKTESVCVANSKFKYINDIKSMFSNFIIEPSFINSEIFGSYKTFLTSMPQNTLLAVGELTNKLPLIFIPEIYEVKNRAETDISDTLPENSINIAELGHNVSDDSTIQAIDNRSEQLINQVAQESEPFESGVMANIFTENDTAGAEKTNENSEDDNLILDDVNDTKIEESASNELSEEISVTDDMQSPELESDNDIELEEIAKPLSENLSEDEINLNDVLSESNENNDVLAEESLDNTITDNKLEFAQDNSIDDIPELVQEVQDTPDIISDEELNNEFSDDNADREIIADVDEIYTSIKDESISDSDLDFIDELNNEAQPENVEILNEPDSLDSNFEKLETLPDENEDVIDFNEPIPELAENTDPIDINEGILPTKEATTPSVPVYSAEIPQEDMVMSDEIYQGDTVTHAKYGTGVVEKMIKYGTKTLYSINFDNVGRRLLDPTLTEIKKN